MMIMRRYTQEVMTAIRDEPFRVLELLLSATFFIYGIYMLTPGYIPESGSPFWQAIHPEVIVRISGSMYVITGMGLFLSALDGSRVGRRIAQFAFFGSILFSMLFRITTLSGFSMGAMFLLSILLTMLVDILNNAAVIRKSRL